MENRAAAIDVDTDLVGLPGSQTTNDIQLLTLRIEISRVVCHLCVPPGASQRSMWKLRHPFGRLLLEVGFHYHQAPGLSAPAISIKWHTQYENWSVMSVV